MEMINELNENQIFVFGSNLAGIHGRGAALSALKKFGAIYGQGIGLQGRSYGIPTKDEKIKTLPLDTIEKHIVDFIDFVKTRPDLEFLVTQVGCGLAGYSVDQISFIFKKYELSENIVLPKEFL